jgi:hypothetical protein
MKKFFILTICALFIGVVPSFGWGRVGHSSIAKIAEMNLSSKAKKQIDKYLHGESIINYSSYPDFFRQVHLFDIGFDATNESRMTVWGHSFQANKDGSLYLSERRGNEYVKNCLLRIDPIIKNLKENHRNMTDSARIVSIAYVVHIIGDIHCPKHVRYEDEQLSGQYPIVFRKKTMSFHSYWDYQLLTVFHGDSFTDLSNLVDRYSKAEQKKMAAGNMNSWAEETAREFRHTVKVLPGQEIDHKAAFEDVKLAEKQIARAGYRLAALLNEIFK